jgi:Arc/MetJ-type ribon-helix-helix transcriptional regulator
MYREVLKMKRIEGGRETPIRLGTEDRRMLEELAEEDMRPSRADMIRVLIRREYLRRKAARYEEQSAQVEATR